MVLRRFWAFGMIVSLLGLCGCATDEIVSNSNEIVSTSDMVGSSLSVSVVAPSAEKLKEAVIQAATSRRYVPEVIDAGTVRCTWVKRAHRVVVDVRIERADLYTITCRECNISNNKYTSWMLNLQRSIAKFAVR